MPKTVKKINPNGFVSARVLQHVAKAVLPFYQAIALHKKYATQWSRAVVSIDSTKMTRLFRLTSPFAKNPLIGTFKSGYNIYFEFKGPIDIYGIDTSLPPGKIQQIPQQTKAHQAIARAILPLYKSLAFNTSFAQILAKAIRRGDSQTVTFLVRRLVKGMGLQSVKVQGSGVTLSFKFSFSPYTYDHILYHPVFE